MTCERRLSSSQSKDWRLSRRIICKQLKRKKCMKNIITGAVLEGIAVIALIISIRHYREKGFLFNNAYLYASKAEREKMNKKPYYRQSARVFLGISVLFLLTAVNAWTEWDGILWASAAVVAVTLVYAVASTIKIEQEAKKKQ